MALMAVMARLAVTPGAWSRVPISGSTRPGIAGQGTKPVHVSAGTAKSEPHGPPAPLSARRVHQCGYSRVRGGARVYPGCTGVPDMVQGARTDQGGNECIYGVPLGQARAGARLRRCQNQCQNGAKGVPE